MIYLRATILCGLVAVSASCSTTPSVTLKSEYVMAMDSLRTSATPKGIPRSKVFYQFQLDGMSSTRHGGGSVRGRWTSAWEEWSLPQGFRLIASKSTYVGRDLQVTPLKEGESFFVPGPRLMVREKYYHEAPLEPYFDSIRLLDKRDGLVAEINLPRKTPAEQVEAPNRR
ncbi:hypothetical protein JIN85_20095 [Luteolibacter pohnpeiensis]|uniref:DUF2846 domain-containing protein n=1 Tax=Luteolibacter pohnpeiensis TaxID=454153 RepID=A0A934SF32_9BACT|nr:hypothetical protein [Luteolibacter pohnpeiensis]MBK1884724.1 hypothetical protein [Luteolibacter pohnpeiensis]